MKSKDNKSTKAKLTKTTKAVLPIFALFGGQGFASSRNPLTLQSSKKVAGKSVIYINDLTAPELPSLGAQVAKATKSPFTAFTNQKVNQTKNADIMIQSKTLSFLNKNNLLSSNKTLTSKITGNISAKNKKSFSHTFAFSTPFSAGTEQCNANVTQYRSFRFNHSVLTSPSFTSCSSYTTSGAGTICIATYTNPGMITSFTTCSLMNALGTTTVSNASQLTGDPSCQLMHQKCADHTNLPVELQKFEID